MTDLQAVLEKQNYTVLDAAAVERAAAAVAAGADMRLTIQQLVVAGAVQWQGARGRRWDRAS